ASPDEVPEVGDRAAGAAEVELGVGGGERPGIASVTSGVVCRPHDADPVGGQDPGPEGRGSRKGLLAREGRPVVDGDGGLWHGENERERSAQSVEDRLTVLAQPAAPPG